jgi:hypothetical protein
MPRHTVAILLFRAERGLLHRPVSASYTQAHSVLARAAIRESATDARESKRSAGYARKRWLIALHFPRYSWNPRQQRRPRQPECNPPACNDHAGSLPGRAPTHGPRSSGLRTLRLPSSARDNHRLVSGRVSRTLPKSCTANPGIRGIGRNRIPRRSAKQAEDRPAELASLQVLWRTVDRAHRQDHVNRPALH